MASHYTKQCQQIVEDYRAAGGPWPAKKVEIAEWALAHNRWQPSRDDIRRMCADALVDAMREDVFTDEAGREVRSMLAAKTTRDGEQGTFWDDLRTAPVAFVRIGVAQRRNGIVADCYHLNKQVRYFNEHHDQNEQIDLSLEFTKDVLELDQPSRKTRTQPKLDTSQSPDNVPTSRSAPPRRAARKSVSPCGPSRRTSRHRTRV